MLSNCVLWKFFGSRKESFFPFAELCELCETIFTCQEHQNKLRKSKPFAELFKRKLTWQNIRVSGANATSYWRLA